MILGEAEAILKIGKARADATRLVAEAIGAKVGMTVLHVMVYSFTFFAVLIPQD